MSILKRSSLLTISLSLLASLSTTAKVQEHNIKIPKTFSGKSTGLKIIETPTSGVVNQPIKVDSEQNDWFKYNFYGTIKGGDTFYGKNTSLLNSNNCEDQLFKVVNKFDLGGNFACGDLLKGSFASRTKAVWGSNQVAPTTTSSTKILDAVGQSHKHAIPRHFMWLREGWIEISVNHLFGLNSLVREHKFTFGSFPFELGRGIALGSAYAVSPDYIGFYSDNAIDQYAFGVKLSGEFIPKKLTYNLYAALLDNQSDSLGKTAQNILGQQYDRLNTPQRGFGNMNRLIAGCINWTILDKKNIGKAVVEPYFLVNTDPEQQIVFLADAESKLGTLGVSGEFTTDRFEFGFDTAFNFGHQEVKGWDNNTIILQNVNGCVTEVNSHVYVNANPLEDTNVSNWNAYRAPHVTNGITLPSGAGIVSSAGSDAKKLVNNAPRNEINNGKSIGIAKDLDLVSIIPSTETNAQDNELFNATNRFRNPYCNKYKGWMMVADASYFIKNRDVRLAVTTAYASGDLDPNIDLKDGDYEGFIGLQELYAGKRVKSSFFLGGAGKLRRPLDTPPSERQPNRFGALSSGFTNLGLIGAGVTWKPQAWEKVFELNPNIIGFWQTFPERSFDLETLTTTNQCARSYLGTELNVYLKKEIFCNLYFFSISSIFIPGVHYDDVKGKPLNHAQQKVLDRLDKTGFNEEQVPGLGNDISFTINLGFEYKF